LNREATTHETIRHEGERGEAGTRGADMSWTVEVIVDDSGEWERDPLRFESEQEALAYARALEFRWSAVRDKRIVKSEDSIDNH